MSFPFDGTRIPGAPRMCSVTLPPGSPAVGLSSRATNSTVSSAYSSPVSLSALMNPLAPSTASTSRSATPYPRRSRPTPAPLHRTPTPSPSPSPPPFSYGTSHSTSSSTQANDRAPSAHRVMIPRKGILKEPGSTNRRNGPSAAQRPVIYDDDDGPQVARTGTTMSDIGHSPASHAVMGIGPKRIIPLKSSKISLYWLLTNQESGGSKLMRPRAYASYEKGFDPRFHPRQELPMRLLPYPAQHTVLSAWIYDTSWQCYRDASSLLEEPASVHSPLRHMTLVFATKAGWTYDLVRPEGIRCIDVLEAMYELLKAPLTADEFNMLARQQTAPITGRPSRGSIFGASALYFQGLRQQSDEVWLVDCIQHAQRWPPQAQVRPQFSSQPQFHPHPQQWAHQWVQQFGAYPRQRGWP
ncbi:hypothetical protein PM082_016691 [Marasmius tenuissimus]|nr:hypothetical protein PM082_016691 [Marasmius tenuissimus]